MTPKRIRRRKAEKRNAQLQPTKQLKLVTPEVKNSVTKKRGFVKAEPDARTQIVKLNSEKLMNDISEMYDYAKKKGMKNANSGTMGMMKNRAELKMFVDKAKEDGLTNAQALTRFKKQFKL